MASPVYENRHLNGALQSPPPNLRASTAPTLPISPRLSNNPASPLNGYPNGFQQLGHNADRIQVVDEDKQFTTTLGQQLEQWGLIDVGFGYNVVAVFGSQSTGKSTLLNRLFGTTFDVMDETRRQQTTKGIWMCRAKDAPLLVMDVEGTDGRERGEDQDFERKSALFSMASSEILIVNMWEHQVGLYQGANMGLLKTVFEVNLNLFGKREGESNSQKTLLLFVIRDHIGATPLANLQATLTADILRIWESLAKPAALAGARLDDYFEMEFVGLPHKILVPEKFEEAVAQLRTRFIPEHAGGTASIFKPSYHKRIPADGIPHYMSNIWAQVQSNKDLDLPTQQELLAQFRCDEIASNALRIYLEEGEFKSLRRVLEAGNVAEGLGTTLGSWKDGALAHYDHAASRYHPGVYKKKRLDLIKTLHTTFHPLFFNQLKNLNKLVLAKFKKSLGVGLKGEGYDFAEIVNDARTVAMESFERGAKEALVTDADIEPWTYDEEMSQLAVELNNVADVFKRDEVTKMINAIERTFRQEIVEPVELGMAKPSKEMWDGVLTSFSSLLEKAESSYLTKATAFNCTEDETTQSLATLRSRAWLALINKVKEHTADGALLARLRAVFEDEFRYDASGVPRVWKPEDDIDGVFKKARDSTLELIPLYARIAPSDSSLLPSTIPPELTTGSPLSPSSSTSDLDFLSSLTLLSETKQLDISSRFKRDADAYFVEAKRSTVSSVAQIPMWMYAVLVVLGWNEAMIVVFNPLYFAFLVSCLGVGYMMIKLNLVGPAMAVGRTVVGEVQRQATDKLREHFSQPQLEAPQQVRRTNTTVVDGDERDEERYEMHVR